ncbi:unnamed protein product [Sphenostylis stenocarpa]|uniref:Uncharacterized protein n=1 Tax=Sphenostylis stenocarpa TaxID=92480 RepID=A0AA86W2Q5_9FABA|nr:unnamed protein product [Sphenostylis stenocarpa]
MTLPELQMSNVGDDTNTLQCLPGIQGLANKASAQRATFFLHPIYLSCVENQTEPVEKNIQHAKEAIIIDKNCFVHASESAVKAMNITHVKRTMKHITDQVRCDKH